MRCGPPSPHTAERQGAQIRRRQSISTIRRMLRYLGRDGGRRRLKTDRMLRRLLSTLVCASVALALASPVLAHAALTSATPGPGDVVTGSPTEIVAQFTQNLDASRTTLEVRDAAGTSLASGGELGDGPREFRLALPVLVPGVYEVRWTTYSAEDAEIGRDTYTFEVVAAPTPPPTPTTRPSAEASPSPSPSPIVPSAAPSPSPEPVDAPASGVDPSIIIPIVVALGAVVAFLVWALRRQRP